MTSGQDRKNLSPLCELCKSITITPYHCMLNKTGRKEKKSDKNTTQPSKNFPNLNSFICCVSTPWYDIVQHGKIPGTGGPVSYV